MDTKFCMRVEKLAREKGVRMNAVLEECNIGKAAYYKWKRGESGCPTADQAVSLAKYFGTTVEYLMTGKPPVLAGKLIKISVLSEQVKKLSEEISANSFVPADDS